MPFWLTWLLVPIVKPVAVRDWMRSVDSAVVPVISLEASPLIDEVRVMATWAASALTIATLGWKPAEMARLSTASPV